MEAKELKQKRISWALTQRQMAHEMGYSDAPAVYYKENGMRPINDRDVMILDLLEIKFKKKG